MKRILISMVAIGAAAALPGLAAAAVSGQCSTCHTMHNSQNDSNMTLNDSQTLGNPVLLLGDCLGCHGGSQANGALGTNDTMAAPKVYVWGNVGTMNDSPYVWLPGGYFESSTTTHATDSYRHNPSDLYGTDGLNDSLLAMYMVNDFAPPGYVQTNTKRAADSVGWSSQLTCAGIYGCHGWTDVRGGSWRGIAGHHHGNDSPYRYLRVTESNTPVKGKSEVKWTDWDANNNGPANNIYFANESWAAGNGDDPTISRLCGECHGNFHGVSANSISSTGDTAVTSEWLRHPTDLKMVDTRWSGRHTRDRWYRVTNSNQVPVGSDDPNAQATANNNAYVICLSCHVAHGSGYKDLLRWDYDLMEAGTVGTAAIGEGCFVCHTSKDERHITN